MTVIRCLTMLACLALFPSLAQAQAYPSKSIRMIIPFPPGGPTDLMGRLASDRLSRGLGVQVIPDNRGGAGGNIGFELCAKSPADGYTVCMMTVAQGALASGMPPEEFAGFVKREAEKWSKVAKAAKVQVD